MLEKQSEHGASAKGHSFSPSLALRALTIFLVASPVLAGEHWPGWRGPTGMGISDERDLPLHWGGPKNANVLWKVPLFDSDKIRRDQNQSSPIVWGERIFVTTSYWPEGVSQKEYPEHHVTCYQKDDGKKLWDCKIPPGRWLLTDLRGGYTAPTPACDGKRVYVLFGSSVLAAVDFGGKILWRKEIKPHAFDVAIGTSPIVYQDTVLVLADLLGNQSRLLAFDSKNGDLKWEQKRPKAEWAHSTPVLAKVNGKLQLLVGSANGPQGLDPANGKILWWCHTKERSGDTVSPVLGSGLVYCDSGRGGMGVAVDPTGQGDVSKTHRKWSFQISEGFSSPVVVGDYLYRLHNPTLISCLTMADGSLVFKSRLEGVETAASPIVTPDGRIYCASAGKSYVLAAGPTLNVLAVNDLGDPSRATPAVAGGRIYFKGSRFLFCVGKK